jgi:hypothetical protein
MVTTDQPHQTTFFILPGLSMKSWLGVEGYAFCSKKIREAF